MPCRKWKEVFNLTGGIKHDMERDFAANKAVKSDVWEEWWNYDWDFLTRKLQPYKSQIDFVNRGRQSGTCWALGRVDRGTGMTIPDGVLIDAHCENVNSRHPDKWTKFINLFEKVYGKVE